MLCGISSRFQLLSPSERQVAHALLTRSPLSHLGFLTEISKLRASFDLHVLGTPPAFVLSQDQTLKYGILTASQRQIKPIRAVCHSLFKRIVRELLRARLKEPFSGAFSHKLLLTLFNLQGTLATSKSLENQPFWPASQLSVGFLSFRPLGEVLD